MNINASIIDVFNALKDKLGEKEAKTVTEYFEIMNESCKKESQENMLKTFATKDDLNKAVLTLIKWFIGIQIGFVGIIGLLLELMIKR